MLPLDVGLYLLRPRRFYVTIFISTTVANSQDRKHQAPPENEAACVTRDGLYLGHTLHLWWGWLTSP